MPLRRVPPRLSDLGGCVHFRSATNIIRIHPAHQCDRLLTKGTHRPNSVQFLPGDLDPHHHQLPFCFNASQISKVETVSVKSIGYLLPTAVFARSTRAASLAQPTVYKHPCSAHAIRRHVL